MFHASYFVDYISKETKSLKNKLLLGNGWAYADLFVSSNFYLAFKIHLLSIGKKMTISYLKKAKKTPQSGSDETR